MSVVYSGGLAVAQTFCGGQRRRCPPHRRILIPCRIRGLGREEASQGGSPHVVWGRPLAGASGRGTLGPASNLQRTCGPFRLGEAPAPPAASAPAGEATTPQPSDHQ